MMNKPGTHIVVIGGTDVVDRVGFELRRQQVEIRDLFRIQIPESTLIGVVGRKETDETVLSTMVKYGTGVIDLNKGRIGTFQNTKPCGFDRYNDSLADQGYRPNDYDKDYDEPDSKGRFPTNFIVMHHSECECVGTKKVSGTATHNGDAEIGELGTSTTFKRGEFISRTDEDGPEEVSDWNCHPTCPVDLLSKQSGKTSTTGYRSKESKNNTVEDTSFLPDNHQSKEYPGDEGTASRFFYQAESIDEVKTYLARLVGSEIKEVQ